MLILYCEHVFKKILIIASGHAFLGGIETEGTSDADRLSAIEVPACLNSEVFVSSLAKVHGSAGHIPLMLLHPHKCRVMRKEKPDGGIRVTPR